MYIVCLSLKMLLYVYYNTSFAGYKKNENTQVYLCYLNCCNFK